MAKTDKAAAKEWYDANVVYPFGFGLNYTTFSFNAKGVFTDEACNTELGSAVIPDLFESAVGVNNDDLRLTRTLVILLKKCYSIICCLLIYI